MSNLTIKKLQKSCVDRCNNDIRPLEEWSPLEWGGSLAGEVGELCNMLKKVRRGTMKLTKVNRKKIAEEIADVLSYLPLVAESVGVDMEEAVIDKFNKVSKKWQSKARL